MAHTRSQTPSLCRREQASADGAESGGAAGFSAPLVYADVYGRATKRCCRGTVDGAGQGSGGGQSSGQQVAGRPASGWIAHIQCARQCRRKPLVAERRERAPHAVDHDLGRRGGLRGVGGRPHERHGARRTPLHHGRLLEPEPLLHLEREAVRRVRRRAAEQHVPSAMVGAVAAAVLAVVVVAGRRGAARGGGLCPLS